MNNELTAKELAEQDERGVTEEDWAEDLKWLDEHGYKIIKKEMKNGGL